MTSREPNVTQISIRLRPAEKERYERILERLKAKYGPSVDVTAKVVMLEGLAALEQKYKELERDRSRQR